MSARIKNLWKLPEIENVKDSLCTFSHIEYYLLKKIANLIERIVIQVLSLFYFYFLDYERPHTYVLAFCVSYFMNSLFKSVAHISVGFFVMINESSLYILDVNLLSIIVIEHIFF